MRRRGMVIAIIVVAVLAYGVYAGVDFYYYQGPHLVFKNAPIGMSSPSGQYRMIESVDLTGRVMFFSVVDNKTMEILYTCGKPYMTKYDIKMTWANKSDDFHLISSDTGSQFYHYENGSWNGDWWLEIAFDKSKNIVDAYIHAYGGVEEAQTIPYNILDIPDCVIEYEKSYNR